MVLVVTGLPFYVSSFAQGFTAKGNVMDKEKQPIIGANVWVKGSKVGTITDLSGNFSIEVPGRNSVLVVKYVGYKDLEVSASSNMRIIMEEDSELLEDVVVIGYGSVKKSDLTGSVTAIKTDEFNKGLQTTAQSALVGKISGVNVVSNSGAPGSSSTIRIRSGASLSASNDPLIVIDGVPVDNSTIEGGGNILEG